MNGPWTMLPALGAAPGEMLGAVALYLLVGLVLSAGLGAAVAVLRVILPGPALAADRSLAAAGTRRLLLAGVVPLLALALLGRALEALGSPGLMVAYLVLAVVPVSLALLLGALAALPFLGERLLERGQPRPLLARCVGGGVALGLCATTLWLQPLFALIALLLGGWLVGIGLGCVLGARAAEPDGR